VPRGRRSKTGTKRRETRSQHATEASNAELDALIQEATADAYDESEQMTGFHRMLDENLGLRLDWTDDNQIAAIGTRGKSSHRIAILDLPLPKPPPEGAE